MLMSEQTLMKTLPKIDYKINYLLDMTLTVIKPHLFEKFIEITTLGNHTYLIPSPNWFVHKDTFLFITI